MFKHLIAASLALASLGTYAASYYVVVPVKGKTVNASAIGVALLPASLPGGVVGTAYRYDANAVLQVTGDPSYPGYGVAWSVSQGSLPAGLTLDARTGVLSGVPTAEGTSSFTLSATYKTKQGTQSYQIPVSLGITVSLGQGTPAQAVVGTSYTYDLKPLLSVQGDAAYNGSGVTWSVVSSTLPAGLSLRTDGTIAGTPSAAGRGSVTARASYKGANGEQTYEVVSLDITVSLASATLPAGKVGTAYTAYDFKPLLSVTGDPDYSVNNVSFSTSGTIPPGLSLSTTGVLSGTPTTKNSAGATFDVVATYKTKTGQQAYTIKVYDQYLEVTKVAASYNHTCAITLAGGVYCWGLNTGRLGNGNATDSSIPVAVVGLSQGAEQIVAGYAHTCVVMTSGGVVCWGVNGAGQLGDGTTITRDVPVAVVGLPSGVSSISLGNWHTCAVTVSGGAWCWGNNGSGQLGNGNYVSSLSPVAVSGLGTGVASIAADNRHTCAVTLAGAAKCWGDNASGQLGDGSTTLRNVPVSVSGLSTGVTYIATGELHSCALTTAGAAKCWGQNSQGQLGNNSSVSSTVPVAVSGLSSGVARIGGGRYYTCALTDSGAVMCWGQNTEGQLGTIDLISRFTPVGVSGLSTGVVDLAVGLYHNCASTTTSGLKCWGYNYYGQVGDGTTIRQRTPVSVINP